MSNMGVDICTVNVEKKQLKLIKSMNLTMDWFSWCPTGNLAVLASNKGMLLTPVLIKQGGVITRLPKIECMRFYSKHFDSFETRNNEEFINHLQGKVIMVYRNEI